MIFPFPNKTFEESERKISDDWKYDMFPLVLKPKDGKNPLIQSRIKELQSSGDLRFELLDDGRALSLDNLTSKALFDEGYTVDVQFIEEREHGFVLGIGALSAMRSTFVALFYRFLVDFFVGLSIIPSTYLKLLIMAYYLRENHSKTPEERMKEFVRLWNYKVEWLKFVPKKGVSPLNLDELKDMRDKLPENRRFAFTMTSGNVVSCDNKHGGLLLMKHGYVPKIREGFFVGKYCENFLQYFLFDNWLCLYIMIENKNHKKIGGRYVHKKKIQNLSFKEEIFEVHPNVACFATIQLFAGGLGRSDSNSFDGKITIKCCSRIGKTSWDCFDFGCDGGLFGGLYGIESLFQRDGGRSRPKLWLSCRD